MSNFEDNRVKCKRCLEFLSDEERVHSVRSNRWNASENDFEKTPRKEFYCSDCWSEVRPETRGAKLEVSSVNQLWGILNGSQGELVADFGSLSVGARPYVQVRNGIPYLATVKARRAGNNTIQFYSSFDEKDKNWFKQTVQSYMEGDLPTIVRIKNMSNTPFEHFPEKGENQETLFEDFKEA
jgi:hypothetical protein